MGLYLFCGEIRGRFGEDLGPVYFDPCVVLRTRAQPLPPPSSWRVRLGPVEPVHGGPGGFPIVFSVVSGFLRLRFIFFSC